MSKKTRKPKLIKVSKDLLENDAHEFLRKTRDLFPDGKLVRSKRTWDGGRGFRYQMFFVVRNDP